MRWSDRAELLSLVKAAARVDDELAGRLERIAHLEALLAPAEVLFQHTLARHGQAVEDVATSISGHWGPRAPNLDRAAFADLMPEVRARSNTLIARAMDGCQEALGNGDYAGAIRLLLDWNKAVMETRGAAPWVRLGDRRRLDVPLSGKRAAATGRGRVAGAVAQQLLHRRPEECDPATGAHPMSAATIPMQVLSRQLGDAIAGRRVRAGVFTTFTFDPTFFELQVLPLLFPDSSFSQPDKVRRAQLDDALRTVEHLAVYYRPARACAGRRAGSARLSTHRRRAANRLLSSQGGAVAG